jgi:hypothetical protein
VAADGSFEFSEVFPGQYSLMVPGMATSTPITVSDTDVRDIEITVPGRKEIFGRVLVEGKGPLPRLSFRTTPSGTTASSPFSNFINISPRADTTFSVILPEGESSLQAPSGLPTGYAFKSMTYGAVDVMKSPLKVDPSDTSQLLVTVTSSANPVKVSGRAEGVDETAISRGIARATLTSPSFALPLNTTIKPDGTFEFAEVFPGNYQARLSGVPTGNAPGVAVVVGTSNVNDVQIVAPAQRSLSGKIEVDRGGVIPRVGLEITTEDPRGGTYGSVVTLNPQPDGTVRVTLPDGEHRLRLVQIPAGYEVSSFRYGSLDLLKSPIKLSRNDTADELRINLSVRGSAPPWVRISGRVLGQTAVVRALRVSLGNGTTVPLDTVVGQDGAFEFTQVLPGTYTLQVTAGIGFSTPPQPKIVTVGNSDLKDVDLSMRLPRLVQGRISVDGGVAAPWLTIDAKNRGGQIVSSTISNGRFLLMLEDGQHRIAIRDLPSNYSLRSILYGSTDLLTQPMNVAEGSEIAVTLSGSPVNSLPTFRMRGRIKGSLLRLPEPRKLIASGPSATDVREVEISADGRFVLASIPNGTYTLRIFGLGSTIVPPKTVTVAGKNLDGIEIEVPTQIQIAGRIVVTAAAQSPEPATAIVAEVQHSRGVYASTADINGSFSLLLPEGRHRVTLNGLPPTYRVQSIRYKSKVVKGGRFEVKPSDAGAEMEIIVGSVNAR